MTGEQRTPTSRHSIAMKKKIENTHRFPLQNLAARALHKRWFNLRDRHTPAQRDGSGNGKGKAEHHRRDVFTEQGADAKIVRKG